MRPGGMLDIREFAKRVKRLIEGNYSYRKILLLAIIGGAFLLYFGPFLANWLFFSNSGDVETFEDRCIQERLALFASDVSQEDASILHEPPEEGEHNYLPYVGNGMFGAEVKSNGLLYIRQGRTLSLPLQWHPLFIVDEGGLRQEASVVHFFDGIVHKLECLREGYYIHSQYYAHRSLDNILVQEVNIVNPSGLSREISLKLRSNANWSQFETKRIRIFVDGTNENFILASGFVPSADAEKMIAVAIVYKEAPEESRVKPRGSLKLHFLTSIRYSEPLSPNRYRAEREIVEKGAVDAMTRAAITQLKTLKEEHISAWHSYWHSGLSISPSKAKDALNGHKINSTIYYVLSHIPKGLSDVEKVVANNEGCYRGHHTLEAPKLWRDTSNVNGINSITKAWLITLEKQGCHRLMAGGPSAVIQAMLLSFGGLLFSNQHLEFNIDPQYLHRDYLFRRLSYGNVTHLNISVTVGEDNRAVLGVALDRSDTTYYGCDAGCLDDPVFLSQSYTIFPVKLTKPLTAILYVTSDLRHMQDLRNALHVHAVDQAPAHDHQVLALHKHGHQLGGLPTFFWVSICFLIVVFHLFLLKIIITEYCDQKDRQRTRYNKP